MPHLRIILAVALGSIWITLSGCGPSIQSSVAAAQKHFQPVLDALANYYQKHGQYPRSLDELVLEGFVAEIPPTPVVSNAMEGKPWYRVSTDRQSCEFHFSYHSKNQLFIGDTTYAMWDSKTGKWSMSGPGY